jgi:hypothetical protein
MPQGVSRLDGAILQRRVWRPGGGDKAVWLLPSGGGFRSEIDSSNMLLQSLSIGTTPWSIGGATTTNAGLAPDGTFTASKYTAAGPGAGNQWFQVYTPGSSGIITDSIYVKQAGSESFLLVIWETAGSAFNNWFNISTGRWTTVNGSTISTDVQRLPDGWLRISVTANRTSGGSSILYRTVTSDLEINNSSGNAFYFLWGAQAEFASTPSPVRPTTTAGISGSEPAWRDEKARAVLGLLSESKGALLPSTNLSRFGLPLL